MKKKSLTTFFNYLILLDQLSPIRVLIYCYDNILNIDTKVKRKKLKGKRAVVRWLKFFRWKKKKEYERMTAEEKILYKLSKVSPFFYLSPHFYSPKEKLPILFIIM